MTCNFWNSWYEMVDIINPRRSHLILIYLNDRFWSKLEWFSLNSSVNLFDFEYSSDFWSKSFLIQQELFEDLTWAIRISRFSYCAAKFQQETFLIEKQFNCVWVYHSKIVIMFPSFFTDIFHRQRCSLSNQM